MINENCVSYEIAKLLKEKGFNSLCTAYYDCFTTNNFHCGYEPTDFNSIDTKIRNIVAAPTLSLVMKWLREVHHYYIQVMLDSWACGGHSGYYVMIQKTDSDFEMMLADVYDKVFYDNPEDACNDAIKYILENLI